MVKTEEVAGQGQPLSRPEAVAAAETFLPRRGEEVLLFHQLVVSSHGLIFRFSLILLLRGPRLREARLQAKGVRQARENPTRHHRESQYKL